MIRLVPGMSALIAQVPRRFPLLEGGSLGSLASAALSPRADGVCTYGSGGQLRGSVICFNVTPKPAPLFHVPILLLVLQLFRSTRCPARPAAHFRPRPGSGGGRAMYEK